MRPFECGTLAPVRSSLHLYIIIHLMNFLKYFHIMYSSCAQASSCTVCEGTKTRFGTWYLVRQFTLEEQKIAFDEERHRNTTARYFFAFQRTYQLNLWIKESHFKIFLSSFLCFKIFCLLSLVLSVNT